MASSGLYYIYASFLWSREKVVTLIQDLQDCKQFGKPHDTNKINKRFNFYSKLFYYYCLAGIIFYFILAHTVGGKACAARNKKYGRNETCGLFSPLWLPFNYNFTPAYEIVAIIQVASSLYAAPVLTISFMIFVIVQHICCKIRHLKGYLLGEISHKRLIDIIHYHQHIIR